jgi:type IV pilus assembly protein PilY1
MGVIMKNLTKIFLAFTLMISVFSANALNLATQPLTTQGSVVPPNLLFILDDSGSMASEYLPDYVNDSNGGSGVSQTTASCKTASGGYTTTCNLTDPPFMSADFNKIYYNPTIQYDPPKLSTGDSMQDMNAANTTGWTSVKIDGYGIQSTLSTNLVTGYPDKKWCDNVSPTPTCFYNGGGSNAYKYPDATYKNSSSVTGSPYYYQIQASEYCSDARLKNCISSAAPSGIYTFPANVRWCTSSTTQTNCQATKVSPYLYVHYSVAGGNFALGTLAVGNSGSTDSVSITSVKVNGVEVMGSTITATTGTSTATTQNSTAASIAAAINSFVSNPEYSATASANVVTIKPALAGIGPNGFVVAVTTPTTTKAGSGAYASASIKFSGWVNNTASVSNIKVNGVTITTNGTLNAITSAVDAVSRLVTSINNRVSSPDYTAAIDTSDVTRATIKITATTLGSGPNGFLVAASVNKITATSATMAGGVDQTTVSMPVTTTNLSGGADGTNTFARVNIVPTTTTYPYYSGRSCASTASCTYAEEMTNFANWYAYYQTRMQMMKSAVGLSFQPIDNKYNVGYFTINTNNVGGDNVDIKTFDTNQRLAWYTQLYKAKPKNSTPLREALSKAGQIFGGQNPTGFTDPTLFSCQQDFTILSTDGYWNGSTGYDMNGSNMGNVDNNLTAAPRPYFDGGTATNASDTLADVAYYYYNYDLRNGVAASPASVKPPFKLNFSNTKNTSGKTTADVSMDNVADPNDPLANWQHMTTFTMGLGIDGVMNFSPSYTSDLSGDFHDVSVGTSANTTTGVCSWQTTGVCNWPKPASDSQNNIDDLWHAAVNGHGIYFSASNPKQVASGLSNALTAVKRATGASSASATSSPNITATDNFIFSSTFRTVDWDGEVVAQTIDPVSGLVGKSVKDPITGQITLDTTPLWVASTWLDASVSATSDSRRILTSNNPTTAKSFSWSGLNTSESLMFSSKGSLMNQFSSLSSNLPAPSQQDIANDGQTLVNYLRGQTQYEGSIFRDRTHVLGDTVNSVPSYVKVPAYNYIDTGYSIFKNISRRGMLYIGANDGMLHAFDASTGEEKWAFAPHTTMPNLYKLADKDYPNKHQYFVDGTPTVSDVFDGSWKTILVGGFNHGGKGYYALDVTDPGVDPKPLWEMCTDATLCNIVNANIGWSYGNPVITKLKDGTWVVLVTSGYESISNFMYVIDAITGQIYHSVSVPGANGLSKLSPFASNADANNTALLVYGGDLDGNLWRFNFTAATKTTPPTVMKFATLAGQPITTKPEVGLVEVRTGDFRIVVSVGTGKYIETTDVNSAAQQSLYTFVDNGVAYTSPRTTLKQRIISGNTVTTIGGANIIDQGSTAWTDTWNPDGNFGGWFVDFPTTSERVNLDPQLVLGTLVVTTNSPDATASCGSSGGASAQYQFNFDTGLAVNPNDTTSTFVTHYQDMAVGLAIYTTPDGSVHGHTTFGGGGSKTDPINIAKGAKSKRNAIRNLRR